MLACVLLSEQIYCYGGGMYVAGRNVSTTLSDHYRLDISKNLHIPRTWSDWEVVNPGNTSFQLEPNMLFSTTVLNNNSYLIDGGLGYNNGTSLVNRTTVYHADTNVWESLPMNDTHQISMGSAVLLNKDIVWFWGGSDLSNDIPFVYPREFNVATKRWSSHINIGSVDNRSAWIQHTGSLSGNNRYIYYMGGVTVTNTTVINEDHPEEPIFNVTSTVNPMNRLLMLDTVQQNWTWMITNGPTPSPRKFHTVVQLPDSNNLLLYGGVATNGSLPVDDFCYILDTARARWTPVSLPVSRQAGPRYGHSAVLYSNRTLFIMFGVDELGYVRDDFFMMDLNTMTWSDYFVSMNSSSSNPHSSHSWNGRLSKGAITGIIMAIFALFGILATLLIFYLLHKKTQQEKEELRQSLGLEGGKAMDSEAHVSSQDHLTAPFKIYTASSPTIVNGSRTHHDLDEPLIEPVSGTLVKRSTISFDNGQSSSSRPSSLKPSSRTALTSSDDQPTSSDNTKSSLLPHPLRLRLP
ncbi:uncharacterized protein BYT42DRAFT_613630 [Radiomyces spectabilis]|uniref:uncharacterized protein n=1 Tax=Radiomyces spectabilis TaxID=64574 RepID=UPI00221FF0EA|nr:uncharacterized protein BYT42DRAFT_613630 [Radiomyces spectabilis]KAI8379309.1 hypothetical protein BYT42DRAFT_613630 [Radiomyces spectabilis]